METKASVTILGVIVGSPVIRGDFGAINVFTESFYPAEGTINYHSIVFDGKIDIKDAVTGGSFKGELKKGMQLLIQGELFYRKGPRSEVRAEVFADSLEVISQQKFIFSK